MSFTRYLLRKLGWYVGALVAAVVLNFLLPRLIPGNPVDTLVSRMGRAGAEPESLRRVHEYYVHAFGLDQPLWEQFWIYVKHLATGDLGVSFVYYPAHVQGLILPALKWSIALQVPAIMVGWLLGNSLGALAAYRGGWLDRSAFLGSLFLSSMPYYCLAILLLYGLAVVWPVLPSSGGYAYGTSPEWSMSFINDALNHYWLPFASLVVVFVGGQAVGMRSMAIYELGSDYVNYGRGLGLRDSRLVRYIFRNGMLPQITGLALSIGLLVSGALITELVFSYPGVGYLLFNAISQNDYSMVAGIALVITVAVLIANFLVEVMYGVIDPRIRAAARGER